ncbi:WXG100 family type VII secretion target [Nocardia sp. bgisy134]|uniref:WXG100 family type VII secretion target n=1 Tax=unclassified Nocardia TaxID=2637762 RepID=UPI003D748B58
MSKPISANFAGVDEGAKQIVRRAEDIGDELQRFHSEIKAFFMEQGGQARNAVLEFQGVWNQHVGQLNDTLRGAGQLVSTGNAELQGTDVALANLF